MVYTFQPGPEAQRLLGSVRRRQIERLWHYTRLRHLAAIEATGGLLPRLELERRHIEYEGHGLGSPAKHTSFGDYICSGIARPWGMMRAESEPIAVISLRRRLIWREGTVFIPQGWCSFGEVTYENTKDSHTPEIFDSMFDNPTTNWPTPHDVEIHVKGPIPIEEFRAIYFIDEDTSLSAANMCPRLTKAIPFIVGRWVFG